mmetsp:Transcript_40992/g.85543  ORF Transcript_40992/g.85543 Transcript_40992/m.85543 type:complete len:305 (+) Transcript_40992:1009-1923(+)
MALQRHPGVERHRELAQAAGEEAADLDVPADGARSVLCGKVGDVVDVRMLEHLLAADVADVELAGEVGVVGVARALARQHVRELLAVAARVDELLRVDSRQRIADQVADVVHARLHRKDPGAAKGPPVVREVLQPHAPQLDVHPSGHVGAARRHPVVPRAVVVLARHRPQRPPLGGGQDAVGHAKPPHEGPRDDLPAVEEAQPLEPPRDVVLVQVLRAALLLGLRCELLELVDDGESGLGELHLLLQVDLFGVEQVGLDLPLVARARGDDDPLNKGNREPGGRHAVCARPGLCGGRVCIHSDAD